MLTAHALTRSIVLEEDRRIAAFEPRANHMPLWLMLHPYTWEEVLFDRDSYYLVKLVGAEHTFRDIPVHRTALMMRGVVKARYADGADKLLVLEREPCEDLTSRP